MLKSCLLSLSLIIGVALSYFLLTPQARQDALLVVPPETVNVALVTDDMRKQVHSLVQQPKVIATGIVLADIWNNERMALYYEVNDGELNKMLNQYIAKFGFKQVIFVPNSEPNELHTQNVLDVINGGSVCTPFDKTLLAKNMPILNDKIKSACMYGVPFTNARYRHYVLMFLSEPDTPSLQFELEPHVDAVKKTMVF